MTEDLKPFLRTAQNTLANTGKVTFMHLADTFIQSDLQCIQVIHFWQYVCSLGIEPTNFCAANAMLYHWATGTGSCPSSCNILTVLGFALANNRYFPQKTYKSSLISLVAGVKYLTGDYTIYIGITMLHSSTEQHCVINFTFCVFIWLKVSKRQFA